MKKVILAALALAPVLTFAQELGNLNRILTAFANLVDTAIPIVVGLALLAFFWGLVKFIFAQGNEEAKSEGKKIMLWGLIALFVMVAVWGLVRFIGSALGISDFGGTIPIPSVLGI